MIDTPHSIVNDRLYAPNPNNKYHHHHHQAINLPIAGAQAFLMDYTHKENEPQRGPSAGWWVLTTAIVDGTNCLTCLPKHGGVRDNKFLVTYLTDQICLTSAIARRSALTAGLSCVSLKPSRAHNKYRRYLYQRGSLEKHRKADPGALLNGKEGRLRILWVFPVPP
jgi:hypothetical protein